MKAIEIFEEWFDGECFMAACERVSPNAFEFDSVREYLQFEDRAFFLRSERLWLSRVDHATRFNYYAERAIERLTEFVEMRADEIQHDMLMRHFLSTVENTLHQITLNVQKALRNGRYPIGR